MSTRDRYKITRRVALISVLAFAVVLLTPMLAESANSQFTAETVTLYWDTDPLLWGGLECSYDFFAKTHSYMGQGPFLLYWANEEPQFASSPPHQIGLIDLGAQITLNPRFIDIPANGYQEVVPVVKGHVYISPDRREYDSRYILFEVIDTWTSYSYRSVTLQYYAIETGSIYVQSNIKTGFTITGPRQFTAYSTPWEVHRVPTGDYSITYFSVPNYTTPPDQKFTLYESDVISFTADYMFTISDTSTEQDPAGSGGFWPIIIGASIGGMATIISAYFGYRAITKKK